MSHTKTQSLWHYSLELYQEDRVKEACLNLQNHYHLNVNVLLFCCWHAATNRGSLTLQDLEKMLNAILSWHRNITANLRQLRQHICKNKHLDQLLKQEILQHEIYSEHIEQEIITDTIPSVIIKRRSNKQKAQDAIHNLYSYYAVAKVTLDHTGYELTRRLLAKSFPNITENDFPQLMLPF